MMGGIAVMSNPQDLVNVDLACILAIVAIMLTVNCYFAAFLFQTVSCLLPLSDGPIIYYKRLVQGAANTVEGYRWHGMKFCACF